MRDQGHFPADYDYEVVDLPADDRIDVRFSDGARAARAVAVSVVPHGPGESWIGSFSVDGSGLGSVVDGLFPAPAAHLLCVVERGVAFLVDVRAPAPTAPVATPGPVTAVVPVVDVGVLLLVTPWAITGVDRNGVAWTTRRLAIDGLRLDEAEDGWLRGVADPADEEPRNFGLNLRTGEVLGGLSD